MGLSAGGRAACVSRRRRLQKVCHLKRDQASQDPATQPRGARPSFETNHGLSSANSNAVPTPEVPQRTSPSKPPQRAGRRHWIFLDRCACPCHFVCSSCLFSLLCTSACPRPLLSLQPSPSFCRSGRPLLSAELALLRAAGDGLLTAVVSSPAELQYVGTGPPNLIGRSRPCPPDRPMRAPYGVDRQGRQGHAKSRPWISGGRTPYLGRQDVAFSRHGAHQCMRPPLGCCLQRRRLPLTTFACSSSRSAARGLHLHAGKADRCCTQKSHRNAPRFRVSTAASCFRHSHPSVDRPSPRLPLTRDPFCGPSPGTNPESPVRDRPV